MLIGVLALQGAFIEHINALHRLNVDAREVRRPGDLEGLDGLIIPGGESTTIGKLIDRFGLRDPIVDLAQAGLPIWGTCAGMILLARSVDDETRAVSQPLLGLMDISVRRNAYGSQLNSFETRISVPDVSEDWIPAIFIRAPAITQCGPGISVLSRLEDGQIIAARQEHLLVTAFHPELTGDDRMHSWFVALASSKPAVAAP